MTHWQRTPTAPFWLWFCIHSCRFCILFRLWGPQPPGSNAMTWGGAYVIITEINCTINVRHLNYPLYPQSMEKLSSMKLVLGAKKVGDNWCRGSSNATTAPECLPEEAEYSEYKKGGERNTCAGKVDYIRGGWF